MPPRVPDPELRTADDITHLSSSSSPRNSSVIVTAGLLALAAVAAAQRLVPDIRATEPQSSSAVAVTPVSLNEPPPASPFLPASPEQIRDIDTVVKDTIDNVDIKTALSVIGLLQCKGQPTDEEMLNFSNTLSDNNRKNMILIAEFIDRHPEDAVHVGRSFRQHLNRRFMIGDMVFDMFKTKQREDETNEEFERRKKGLARPEDFQCTARSFLELIRGSRLAQK